jgi:hypothetical protein
MLTPYWARAVTTGPGSAGGGHPGAQAGSQQAEHVADDLAGCGLREARNSR